MQENLVARIPESTDMAARDTFQRLGVMGLPGLGVDLGIPCLLLSILPTCSSMVHRESRAVQWVHESKVLKMQICTTQPSEKVLVRVE